MAPLPNVWSARAASVELAVSVYLATIAAGIFVGYLTAFRVLMVWIYDRTQSVLVAMLMHASFTASLLILNPVGLAGARLVVYSFALAGALWLAVAAVAAANRGRRRLPGFRRNFPHGVVEIRGGGTTMRVRAAGKCVCKEDAEMAPALP